MAQCCSKNFTMCAKVARWRLGVSKWLLLFVKLGASVLCSDALEEWTEESMHSYDSHASPRVYARENSLLRSAVWQEVGTVCAQCRITHMHLWQVAASPGLQSTCVLVKQKMWFSCVRVRVTGFLRQKIRRWLISRTQHCDLARGLLHANGWRQRLDLGPYYVKLPPPPSSDGDNIITKYSPNTTNSLAKTRRHHCKMQCYHAKTFWPIAKRPTWALSGRFR